jgi:hypothetical protein
MPGRRTDPSPDYGTDQQQGGSTLSISFKTLGRSIAIAALTASALTVGAVTASAEPATATATAQASQVSASIDAATSTITATLASGRFVDNVAAQAIDVLDAAGATIESIPLTVSGERVPVAATVSPDGSALVLRDVSTLDTANTLWSQWVWGVTNGGWVGAVIGCLIGAFLFFLGCIPGIAIGGAIGSPNSGEINGSFVDLLSGR